MIRLSASGVPRGLACPSSLIRPRHLFDNKWAALGTERHADDEAAIDLGGADDVLPAAVVAMLQPGDKHTTEPAFAYDTATDTARALGNVKDRDYPITPYEIPGRIDLLVVGNGRAIVVDKKGFLRVGAAEENPQTLTYALMVARTMNLDEITVVIYYELGALDIAVISAMQLDAHAARLKKLQLDVVLAARDPAKYTKAGPHCRYCESFFYCEVQQGFQLEVSSADGIMKIEASIPFERDEDAAQAFDLWERLKLLTNRVGSALHARAAEHEFLTSDGKVFGPREKLGNLKLDGDKVWSVLRQDYGLHIADAAIERKATGKRLEAALKLAVSSGGTLASRKRDVIAKLKANGGATQETKTVVDVHEREAPQLKAAND